MTLSSEYSLKYYHHYLYMMFNIFVQHFACDRCAFYCNWVLLCYYLCGCMFISLLTKETEHVSGQTNHLNFFNRMTVFYHLLDISSFFLIILLFWFSFSSFTSFVKLIDFHNLFILSIYLFGSTTCYFFFIFFYFFFNFP